MAPSIIPAEFRGLQTDPGRQRRDDVLRTLGDHGHSGDMISHTYERVIEEIVVQLTQATVLPTISSDYFSWHADKNVSYFCCKSSPQVPTSDMLT